MKKAEVDPMKLIILFIILAITAAIVLYIFNTQVSKEKAITESQLDSLTKHSDADGIPDALDQCPYQTGPKPSGCPEEKTT